MRAKEQSYTTTPITAYFHDEFLGRGTGFIYQFGQSYALITNWHVLSGRHPDTHAPRNTRTGFTPNRIEFHAPIRLKIEGEGQKRLLNCKAMDVALEKDSTPIWWECASRENFFDVAMIELNNLLEELAEPDTDLVAIQGGQVAVLDYGTDAARAVNLLPEIAEEVFILGYPEGQSFQNLLPVWKRGTIASEPLFAVRQTSMEEERWNDGIIFVDAATNQGMSGAPVLYFRNNLLTAEGDKLGDASAEIREAPILVGVYAGRDGVSARENDMGLGRIWKTSCVDQLFFDHNRARGGSILQNQTPL